MQEKDNGLIVLMILFFLVLLGGALSGCVGAQIERDALGRVYKIKTTGFFPVKAKIENCEIDSRVSLFDFNMVKEGL